MTYDTPLDIRQNVKKQLNNILLCSTFADTVNSNDKILDIITFPEDINLIKERIKDKFKFNIHNDISNMTVNELCTLIFIFVTNSKKHDQIYPQKNTEPQTTEIKKSNDGKEWNRRMIFGYIIGNIRNAFGRPVQSTEKISDLIREAHDTGIDSTQLTSKLKELEKFFDIKIDLEMRIYNIGNEAEKSFIAQGKAPDSRIEYESMEPLWATIHAALPINYWQSVILNELNVRISPYKLARIKSFPEFEALVAETRKKQK